MDHQWTINGPSMDYQWTIDRPLIKIFNYRRSFKKYLKNIFINSITLFIVIFLYEIFVKIPKIKKLF